MNKKPDNLSVVNEAVEAGEKLYPNTAADGREIVRNELRQLKVDWQTNVTRILARTMMNVQSIRD